MPPLWEAMKPMMRRGFSSLVALASKVVIDQALVTVTSRRGGKTAGHAWKSNVGVRGGSGGGKRRVRRGKESLGRGQTRRGSDTQNKTNSPRWLLLPTKHHPHQIILTPPSFRIPPMMEHHPGIKDLFPSRDECKIDHHLPNSTTRNHK